MTKGQQKRRYSLKERLDRWAARVSILLLAQILRFLPLGMMYWLAERLGHFLFVCLPSYRRRTVNHICLALGKEKSPSQVYQTARQSFETWTKGICEILYTSVHTSAPICRRVTIQGLHHLEAALAQGQGVIHLGAHLGNFPLVAAVLARMGYAFTFAAKDPRDRVLARYLHNCRVRLGIGDTSLDSTRTAALKVLRCLKRNEIISLVADQHAGWHGVVIDFFGRPISAATGPAFFALRTGAPILPMFVIRQPDESHVLFIDPPIEVSVTGDQDRDILDNTTKCMQVIESYVRRYPSQWFWVPRRWRSDPKGEA